MRRIDIAARARADIGDALAISYERFGAAAMRRYQALITRAQKLLARDPARPGVWRSDELPTGAFLFRLRHARTRGAAPKQPRHFILFRCDDERIIVLRVLHDSMDIEQRVSNDDDKAES